MRGTRAHKVDGNQRIIVEALKRAGCEVFVTSAFGDGYPDITARRRGSTDLPRFIEVKAAKGKLTAAESRWCAMLGPLYSIARTPAEALRQMGFDVLEKQP